MGLKANRGPIAQKKKKKNTAHLRTFFNYRGDPGDPHEAISGFSGILSCFRFYFLEEIGWSLVLAWCQAKKQKYLKKAQEILKSIAEKS